MKKFLSLVLALVMTMSLVTISAGAADFNDNSDIAYAEAVDVMSAAGVIDGYADGSFQPTVALTRGAAAKIICNMILGPTTAEALSADAAPFVDVPANHTFAGHIAYCSQQGIINGYADGTFRPAGTLDGYSFMKMLLGALGYDGSVENFTGANWSVNVAKLALAIGLDDGNDSFVGSATVTREEAMLYAFNTMQATMVEYANSSTITVGDITISNNPARSEVANTARSEGIDDDDLMQFAERYFRDLEKIANGTDVFNRPAHVWEYDDEEVGTYADDADEVYVVDSADKTVRTIVTGSDYMNYASRDVSSDVEAYLNSDEIAMTDTLLVGDIVEAFEDDGDVVTVVVRRYTAARIDEVDEDLSAADTRNGASVELTLTDLKGDVDYGNYFDAYRNDENVLPGYTSEYEEDAVLAVAFNDADEVIDSYVAKAVSGDVTAYKANETITLAGTRYNFAAAANVDGDTNGFDFDEEYNLYLTAEDYVIGVEGATVASLDDVYYVAGVYGERSRYNTSTYVYYAQVVSLADGAVSDIELDAGDTDQALASEITACGTASGAYQDVGGLYTFDDDVATEWAGEDDYNVTETAVDNGAGVKSDASRVDTDAGRFYLDSTTRYLAVDDKADDIDTKTATGGMKAADDAAMIVISNASNRDAVYILYIDAKATAASEDVVYVANASYDRIGSERYEGTIFFMEDGSSDEVVLKKAYPEGFYIFELDDGVYELSSADSYKLSGIVGSDSDGWLTGLELDDDAAIYRNGLSVTFDGVELDDASVEFDDASMANAVFTDARSASERSASAYDRVINSVSRLSAAVEAAEAASGVVTIDVYVTDGDITYICVTAVGDAAEDPEDPEPADPTTGFSEEDEKIIYTIANAEDAPRLLAMRTLVANYVMDEYGLELEAFAAASEVTDGSVATYNATFGSADVVVEVVVAAGE